MKCHILGEHGLWGVEQDCEVAAAIQRPIKEATQLGGGGVRGIPLVSKFFLLLPSLRLPLTM